MEVAAHMASDTNSIRSRPPPWPCPVAGQPGPPAPAGAVDGLGPLLFSRLHLSIASIAASRMSLSSSCCLMMS
eukprot:8316210-Heterocapsa_arctica.AAC.1